jgi:hypothetical protein
MENNNEMEKTNEIEKKTSKVNGFIDFKMYLPKNSNEEDMSIEPIIVETTKTEKKPKKKDEDEESDEDFKDDDFAVENLYSPYLKEFLPNKKIPIHQYTVTI